MKVIGGIYIVEFAVLIVIALVSWFIWDRRYRENHRSDIPQGYEATGEVFVDPVTHKKMRVYYDPRTGKRLYHEEPENGK